MLKREMTIAYEKHMKMLLKAQTERENSEHKAQLTSQPQKLTAGSDVKGAENFVNDVCGPTPSELLREIKVCKTLIFYQIVFQILGLLKILLFINVEVRFLCSISQTK